MTQGTRELIVLSDGTGNSASKPFKTNVWRLYQALDLTDGKQVALFGDGVGNSSITILRVLGLALGIGVKRNVLDLYKFLCRNYRKDDRIWIFGFSRGAFTVRVLAGLIHSQGLISCKTEAELEYSTVAAYRAYRQDKKAFATKIPWVWAGRRLRDLAIRFWRALTGGTQYADVQKQTVIDQRRDIPIHFVGVWDTVAAYGLPIDELTIAVDKWVWPMKFRDTSLLSSVQHARHALGLDDERRTFHPVPWDERYEKLQHGAVDPDRLTQVWFPGMHSDVGGGYPDDGLAYVPLCWMIDQARAKHLRFEEDVVATYRALASPTGRLYDSRAGSGVLWRYQPRNVEFLMHRGEDEVPAAERVTPLVHHCAVTRMTYGNDNYAPFSLPLGIDILLPDQTRVAFADQPVKDALAATAKKIPGAKPDELPVLKYTEDVLKDLGALVQSGVAIARHDYFALVLDTVWFRRIVYFVTLGLALVALAYPVLYEALDFGDTTAKADEITTGFLIYVIALVKGFLPGFTAPWLDAISENGLGAVVIGVLFILSLALSALLQQRIHDRARAAWNVHTGRKMQHLAPTGQRHALLTLTAIGAIITLFARPVWDSNEKLFWTIAGFTVLFFALYIYRRIRPPKPVDPSEPGFPLAWARKIRTSPRWVGGYRWVAQTLAPILFILLVGYLGLSVLNLVAFNAASTVGGFCPDVPEKANTSQATAARAETKSKQPPKTTQQLTLESQDENLEGIKEIDIKSRCYPTGLKLVAGRQYRIRLETDNWFDKSIPSDVAGFSSDSLRQILASPLKRWWREKWFQPIARVGLYGNYEYPLKPAAPLAEADFSVCKPASPPFWTALGQTIAGSVDTLLHPGRIVDGIRDIPNPASEETIKKQLGCESEKDSEGRTKVRRAVVLISDITPAHSGELFIYVNDSVLAIPGLTNFFYRNNTGTAKVTAARVIAPEIIWQGAQPAQKN